MELNYNATPAELAVTLRQVTDRLERATAGGVESEQVVSILADLSQVTGSLAASIMQLRDWQGRQVYSVHYFGIDDLPEGTPKEAHAQLMSSLKTAAGALADALPELAHSTNLVRELQ